jgi:mercuric ion transport protein
MVGQVELIYDRDCPNVERARTMIRQALEDVGAEVRWTEWDREDARTPAELKHYGSPTVLVDGKDVGCNEQESSEPNGNSCRVYADETGCLCGAPSAKLITDALRRVTC